MNYLQRLLYLAPIKKAEVIKNPSLKTDIYFLGQSIAELYEIVEQQGKIIEELKSLRSATIANLYVDEVSDENSYRIAYTIDQLPEDIRNQIIYKIGLSPDIFPSGRRLSSSDIRDGFREDNVFFDIEGNIIKG